MGAFCNWGNRSTCSCSVNAPSPSFRPTDFSKADKASPAAPPPLAVLSPFFLSTPIIRSAVDPCNTGAKDNFESAVPSFLAPTYSPLPAPLVCAANICRKAAAAASSPDRALVISSMAPFPAPFRLSASVDSAEGRTAASTPSSSFCFVDCIPGGASYIKRS